MILLFAIQCFLMGALFESAVQRRLWVSATLWGIAIAATLGTVLLRGA